MLCCSIPAISFLQYIRTAHLLPFMVHGTGLRSHRLDSLLYLYHLKTACQPANGKFLLMDSPDSPVALQPEKQYTVLADWPRAPMVRCSFPMIAMARFGK